MLALVAAALLAAAGGPATAARPARPAVMIARPADADPVLEEATFRLRSELAAAGYDSQVATCAVDPLTGPADCPREGTVAAISLVRANGTTSIFVTSRRRSGRELRRHVRVSTEDGGADATLLAVRAVELLRDLQLEVAQVAEDDENPKPVELFQEPAGAQAGRWSLWGGGSMLLVPWTASRPVGPTWGGIIGVGAELTEQVMLVLDAAGPFAGSLPIGAPNSTASYSDRPLYAVVSKLALCVGTRSAVRGMFSKVFVGLSYTHVQLDPTISTDSSGSDVTPMVGFGPGYTLQITPRLLVSINLELVATSSNFRIAEKTGGSVLAQSGMYRVFLNVTTAVRLP
jgi:hypothetical protein